MTVRWGILATGGIAATVTEELLSSGHTVVAAGSRSLDSAKRFADRFGIPNAHGSYDELVSDPDVDAIYIATPHPGHAENAIRALRAGKHVVVEKPFTLNAAEAREVVDVAREAGLVVLEAMWVRFLPHTRRIHEIIDAGTIGEVRTVSANFDVTLPKDPTNRLYAPELGGGALLDLGIYPISFAIDVLGLPTRVLASSAPTDTGVDRQTAVIFEHEGARQSLIHTALDTNGEHRATILGTGGRIEVTKLWGAADLTVHDAAGDVIERFSSADVSDPKHFQFAEAERLIAAGETDSALLSPDESVSIMEVLDEIRAQIGLVYPQERE
jgi:predicted dehydrogenase